MRCMESDAGNSPFQFFGWIVLLVAEDRVSNRGELNTDLILQPGDERHPDERCSLKGVFHGIAQLGANRLGVALRRHPLKQSLLPKVVDECPLLHAEMTPNHREILPHRAVPDKLLNQRFSIPPAFREEQNSGRELIDPMHDIGPLPLRCQFFRKKRERGPKVGVVVGYCQHFGRLVEDHDGIVLVKDAKLPPILLSKKATDSGLNFLHDSGFSTAPTARAWEA